MTDLVDFLLARIRELAEEAFWLHGEDCDTHNAAAIGGFPCDCPWPKIIEDDCEAKRRIVTALSEGLAKHWGPREDLEREWEWCPKARTAEFCEGTDLEWGPDAPCECAASSPDYLQAPLLRLFALPYADHPDYREEWKP